jgi:hypothetical protein
MKRLSLYLFLIFFTLQTPSQADDIRDFQIEGISIGDSALDYFSEEEIKKETNINIYSYKKDKTFVQTAFSTTKHNFNTYEIVMIEYKKNDKDYIIHGLSGKIISIYKNDIEACFKKQDKVFKELSQMFKNQKINPTSIKTHPADKSGKSKVRMSSFQFNQRDIVIVACYNYHKDMPYSSNFKVNLFTNELNEWLYENN